MLNFHEYGGLTTLTDGRTRGFDPETYPHGATWWSEIMMLSPAQALRWLDDYEGPGQAPSASRIAVVGLLAANRRKHAAQRAAAYGCREWMVNTLRQIQSIWTREAVMNEGRGPLDAAPNNLERYKKVTQSSWPWKGEAPKADRYLHVIASWRGLVCEVSRLEAAGHRWLLREMATAWGVDPAITTEQSLDFDYEAFKTWGPWEYAYDEQARRPNLPNGNDTLRGLITLIDRPTREIADIAEIGDSALRKMLRGATVIENDDHILLRVACVPGAGDAK